MTATATRPAPRTTRSSSPAPTSRVYMKVRTEVLAAIVTASGFTHQEVAIKAKMSRTMVTVLTSGHRKTCSPETAKRVSKALKMPVATLFETVAS